MKSLSCEPVRSNGHASKAMAAGDRAQIVQSHPEPNSVAAKPKARGLEIYIRAIERMKSSGIKSHDVAARLLAQTGSITLPACSKDTALERLELAAGMLVEMAPSNLTEAMLATQMTAVHEAAVVFIKGATQENQTSDGRDANVLRATRLMRLFTEQLQAMQKLKGTAAQQKVTVEHVHIHGGGQAIVGAVAARIPGEGVGGENRNRGNTP